ncbi:AAA family ATPase [Psychrobacter sp. NPDC078409]|uniref:AAA family ATPase n=1 Tax=Psychrobacter sp. NPDC078409 TaxID=3390660 RepID=UPI003CFC6D3C
MEIITVKEGDYVSPAFVTKDEWKQLLSNKNIMKRSYLDVLIAFYLEPGHKSTCKALGDKYDLHHNTFNGAITQFGKQVQKELNRFQIVSNEGGQIYWRIVMTGRYDSSNLFEWKMRDELVDAMEDLNFVDNNYKDMEMTLSQNKQYEFTWIPAFKAISDWLVDFENKQEDLVDILIAIGIDNGLQDQLIKNEKSKVKVMDPFSFFSLIMKYGETRSLEILTKLLTKLELQNLIPTDLNGLPRSNPQKVWMFPYGYIRKPEYIPMLWQIFHQARAHNVDDDLFNSAMDIPGTAFTKLTQNLFYIDPSKYLPVDSQTRPWLTSKNIDAPKDGWLNYQETMDNVASKTDQTFYEISYEAWLLNKNKNKAKTSNTVSSKSTEYGIDDDYIPQPLNRILYGPPGTGKTYKTTELAVECIEPEWYQTLVLKDLADDEKRILLKQKYDELTSKGRIAFTTFHQSFAYEDFIEGIRPTVNKGPDNQSIISYDVIPGIFRSICSLADTNAKERTGSTQSVNIDGKKIWKLSLGNTLEDEGEDIFNECIENNYILLGWGEDINFTGCENRKQVVSKFESTRNISLSDDPYNYLATAVNSFKNVIKTGDLVIISDGNHKFRAIAEVTGNYEFLDLSDRIGYQQSRKVKWLRVYETSLPKEKLFEKALSQMTLYNLKDSTINRDKLKELLTVHSTESSVNKPHLIIIDEINRGNISRIFGELITLLEADKRKDGSDAREVTLPYSKEKFSVPSNLYVLGTMNTADKSLAQIDFALRRRFEFIELLPEPKRLEKVRIYNVSVSELLEVINQRIEVLLDREHTIGHAYFWSLMGLQSDEEREEELASIFENRIIPLLQEYFFSDWERIGWVLNDPAKDSNDKFIQVDNLTPDVKSLFHDSVTDQIMDRRYRINNEAFNRAKAYAGIVSSNLQAE